MDVSNTESSRVHRDPSSFAHPRPAVMVLECPKRGLYTGSLADEQVEGGGGVFSFDRVHECTLVVHGIGFSW